LVSAAYAKCTAIKVLNQMATNSVITLLRIKKLVGIGLAPESFYKYGPGEDEDEDDDVDEADVAIWSGGTGKEPHQGNGEEQPVDEEQEPVDE
jgi:hypothetical protein